MQNYIYGAGGHGKVVLDAMQAACVDCAGFVDDREISSWASLSVFKISSLMSNDTTSFHLAIGNCKTRETLANQLIHANYFNVFHPSAVIAKTARISTGTFVAAQAVIAPYACVGHHCIINHAAVVDHDCQIGDYVHIAPHSCLGGGVKVGKGVLIGTGAVVLPGITIGDYAIIGAGAVVTKNVIAASTVVGIPANLI